MSCVKSKVELAPDLTPQRRCGALFSTRASKLKIALFFKIDYLFFLFHFYLFSRPVCPQSPEALRAVEVLETCLMGLKLQGCRSREGHMIRTKLT